MLLHQQKPVLKRYLLAAGDAPSALAALPTDFRQLPDKLRQDAFGDRAPADLTATAVAFLQAAKSMPLRGTNRAIAASSAVSQHDHDEETSEWTARMVSAAVRGAMAATRVPDASVNASVRPTASTMLAVMDAPRGDRGELPGADVVTPVSMGPGESLALPPQAATAAALLDVSMSPPTVAEQLAALCGDAQAKKNNRGLKKRAAKVTMKRPAAAITSTGCDGKKTKAGKTAEGQESKKAKSMQGKEQGKAQGPNRDKA